MPHKRKIGGQSYKLKTRSKEIRSLIDNIQKVLEEEER